MADPMRALRKIDTCTILWKERGTSYVFGIPKTLAKRGSFPLVTPSKASA
jgi:hypothetical protein